MDYNTIREQCETCLSYNYIDSNAENIGYEAFECWNCKQKQFLPDEGLYCFMDRVSVEEDEALQLIKENNKCFVFVDGRSVP